MPDNLRLLEDLVVEAIGRLRGLTAERDGFRDEVGTLRQRLEALQREADPGVGAEWGGKTRQAQALSLVREVRQTLSELHGE